MQLGPGRVAVITGAASGIGRALALHLARRGCDLALVDIDCTGLGETAAVIEAAGRRASVHEVDVADEKSMRALPEAVLDQHAAIHLLVNNAGVSLAGPFEWASLEDMRWIHYINFWGVVHGCKFFLPALRREAEAQIVNISSDFGLIGFPQKTLYCAGKFAVRGFSESLRAELYGTGVGVTCVYPGAVDTAIVRKGRVQDPAKRDIEAEFVRRRSIKMDTATRKIVRAIERDRARVRIGRDTYAIDLMTRLFPVSTNKLVSRIQRRLPFL
jgi:short-subunit dehydrogenase